jgi:hypothetical protein
MPAATSSGVVVTRFSGPRGFAWWSRLPPAGRGPGRRSPALRRTGPCWRSVPEVRRLLVALVWRAPVEPGFVLAWSRWRRRHQARARRGHYRRREQQLLLAY